MSSTNNTVSQMLELCRFTGLLQWREEYLTPAVHRNLIVNSIVNGFSFPFTALLNVFFILCILLKPNLRRKKSSVLMGYLAVTDLVVGVIVQPISLASVLCQMTGRCNFCAVDTARVHLLRVSSGSSLVHVTLIAWERYIAIKHALQYKLVVTTKRLLAGTIAAWFISVALISILFFHVLLYQLLFTIAVLICFAAIVYFYIVIYLESKRHFREIKASNPLPKTNLLPEKDFKAAKTTAIIFGCLLICYGPSFAAIIIEKFIFPVNRSNATIWACINPWIPTLIMLNSLCNPLIYGWRVKEFRHIIASIFQIIKCCSTNDTQQSEIEIIKMVELNADRKLTNVSFADSDKSRWNTSVDSNDEASVQHKCRCKTTTPLTGIRNNMDSANDLEVNFLSSKANSSKMEQNTMTVTAVVHVQSKPNLQQHEILNEDADTLFGAIAKEIPCKSTITQTEASFKSQEDIEKSGSAATGLEQRKTRQEMNDRFPCLAAIIEKLEKEEPNRLAAIREQIIEVEQIDFQE